MPELLARQLMKLLVLLSLCASATPSLRLVLYPEDMLNSLSLFFEEIGIDKTHLQAARDALEQPCRPSDSSNQMITLTTRNAPHSALRASGIIWKIDGTSPLATAHRFMRATSISICTNWDGISTTTRPPTTWRGLA